MISSHQLPLFAIKIWNTQLGTIKSRDSTANSKILSSTVAKLKPDLTTSISSDFLSSIETKPITTIQVHVVLIGNIH